MKRTAQITARMTPEYKMKLKAVKECFDLTHGDLIEPMIDALFPFTSLFPSRHTTYFLRRYMDTHHPVHLAMAQDLHSVDFRSENNATADYNGFIYHEDLPDIGDYGTHADISLRNVMRTYLREVLQPELALTMTDVD